MKTGLKITNTESDVPGCSNHVQILRIEKKKKISEAFTFSSSSSLLPPHTENHSLSLFYSLLIHSGFMFKLGKYSLASSVFQKINYIYSQESYLPKRGHLIMSLSPKSLMVGSLFPKEYHAKSLAE